MNIYEFVNSRDVREWWQKIGFTPTALESAWIVRQSLNHTVSEKHAAWRYIIDNMPDCEIFAKPKSLHKLLEKFMEIENKIISEFFRLDDGAIYTYRAIWKEDFERDDDNNT